MRESSNANQAFQDYLALGPQRSLRKLCEHYRRQKRDENGNGHEASTPTTRFATLADWSRRHNWQARVAEIEAGEAKPRHCRHYRHGANDATPESPTAARPLPPVWGQPAAQRRRAVQQPAQGWVRGRGERWGGSGGIDGAVLCVHRYALLSAMLARVRGGVLKWRYNW